MYAIVIFILVFITSCHIAYHNKISDDETVYELQYDEEKINTYNVLESLELKQPVICNGINDVINKGVVFRPQLTIYTTNKCMTSDIINSTTQLKYDVSYRNSFLVSKGTVHIKMALPKSTFEEVPDYYGFEFNTKINPWKSPNIKFIDVTLTEGQCIFIPPYWWYSFKFESDTIMYCTKHVTFFNMLAFSPKLLMCLFHKQTTNCVLPKKCNYVPKEKEKKTEEHELD